MKRKLVIFVAAAGLAVGFLSSTAGAAPPAGVGDGGKPAGIACQQDGIDTLRTNQLLTSVAKNGIEVVGLGNVAFQDVLKYHRDAPSLFQTGGVSVVLPDDTVLPATWCNPS